MGKKIILINGFNILGEMLVRAIDREVDLEIEYHFHSNQELIKKLNKIGSLESKRYLFIGASNQDVQSARMLLSAQSDLKTINLAGDGSKVTLGADQQRTIKNLNLSELLELLRSEK